MKKATLFTLLIVGAAAANAQRSNTSNQFYDSLDMPVARTASDQKNPLVIKSDPDGGYFVIWEDFRSANGNSDIRARVFFVKMANNLARRHFSGTLRSAA